MANSVQNATLAEASVKSYIYDNDTTLRPYRDWLAAHFTPAQRSNPAIIGNCADPDHDGVSNGLEFLLDSDPANPSSGPGLIHSRSVAGSFSADISGLQSRRNIFLVNVTYSKDLLNWADPAPADLVDIFTAPDNFLYGIKVSEALYLRLFVSFGIVCLPFDPEP